VLQGITPLVLTWNEAPNIQRCLERLSWAPRVIVLDSGSTDDTVVMARQFPNVEVVTRAFDNHAAQRNYGISLVATPWVLSLDADFLLPVGAEQSLTAAATGDADAMVAAFRYCVFGRPLRASLYPPRPVLFRRDRCRYEPDGHTERLVLPRSTARLPFEIDHDDRKPLARWFASQVVYADLEAEKLVTMTADRLTARDRLRRSVVFGPPVIFFYTLIVKGALFDGWPGWYYALQRGVAEAMLSVDLLDRKLRR